MATLTVPQNTIQILQKYHIREQKKYGQNFLIDGHVLDRIVEAADLSSQDFVLEIGPGIGTMTQALCRRAGHVLAVEIDPKLMPVLKDTLSAYSNVTLLNADILKMDLPAIAGRHNGGEPVKVVANLPYYITTPIIMELFESRMPLDSVTVMVQQEVAKRMQASPGTKDYGALSLAVQYYAKTDLIATVPPNCFMPRPKVSSAVVQLKKYQTLPVTPKDEQFFFRVIRAAFNQRRKMLTNALENDADLPVTKQMTAQALKKLGLSDTVRGEKLSLEEFCALCDILYPAVPSASD